MRPAVAALSSPRCAGANRDQLTDFKIYAAKALAGIGRLPSTIADRTIEIRLKRKKAGEEAERFRRREVRDAAEPLYQNLSSLLEYHVDRLACARPELPEGIDDRAADMWEPLIAIADLAEGEWPERARRAAVVLSGGDTREDDSNGVVLLRDVRGIFERRGVDRIASSPLCDDLHEIEESPWGEWHGKPITPRGVAKILARYEIEPRQFRFGEHNQRGYERAWFADAWARHLPSPGDLSATPLQTTSEQGFLSKTDPLHAEDVADTKTAANPHESSDVADVADTNGRHGGFRVDESDFKPYDEAELERLARLARESQRA